MLKQLDKYQLTLFICIAVITIATRFIWLGELPGGLNQDEASMGYDAYALLEYGIDRNGIHNPVHMIAWGSGQNALLAYISMPFIKIFGLSVFSIRIAPALLGCFAVFIIFLLGRRIESTNFGLIVAGITAISPWHIMISRWALESNILPVFMLTSVYLLIKASDNKRFLPLSFFFFGVSLYAYAPSYLVIPLFLIMAGFYCMVFKVFTIKNIVISVFILIIVALPIFIFVLINTLKLPAFESDILSIPRYTGTPRYTHMSSIYGGAFFQETAKHLAHSIKILFIDFNDFELQNSAPKVGYLPKFSLPLIIGGFFICIWKATKNKSFNPVAIILIWFFCSFIVSGTSSPAIHRMNTVIFPIIIFFAYGLYTLFNNSKALALAFCLILSVTSYNFYKIYTTEYAVQVSSFFFQGYGEAVRDAQQYLLDGESLYASDALNQPYIATLFHLKYDPNEYIKTVEFKNPGGAFQSVSKYGNIIFGVRSHAAKSAKVVVIRKGDDARYYNLNNYITREYYDYLTLYSKEVFQEDAENNIIRKKIPISLSMPTLESGTYFFNAQWEIDTGITIEAVELYGTQRKIIKFGSDRINNRISIEKSQLYLGSNKLIITARSSDGRKKTAEFVITNYDSRHKNAFDFIKTIQQDIGNSQRNKAFTQDNLLTQGIMFTSGLGTHASSKHIISLPINADRLHISYGISDFSGGCGQGLEIEISSDDKLLTKRKVYHNRLYSSIINIDNLNELTLTSKSGSNRHCDHLNWLSADLVMK
ncbi:NPCBM/NEW2 domain-containing protein [Marinagarivorans algicola]|uniref:NPCBM/NEW2 domain-containing protein n=1 Tax=Marinagarivorans algicola TaxID=1513270 RepID=UPI0037365349